MQGPRLRESNGKAAVETVTGCNRIHHLYLERREVFHLIRRYQQRATASKLEDDDLRAALQKLAPRRFRRSEVGRLNAGDFSGFRLVGRNDVAQGDKIDRPSGLHPPPGPGRAGRFHPLPARLSQRPDWLHAALRAAKA